MAKVWKDCWYPGTYTLADGRREPYTADDIRLGVENTRGLLAKGFPLPVAWRHDAGNLPRAAAQLAQDAASRNRQTFGWVEDVRLSPEGFAEVLLEVPDEADLRQLPKTRFVSPQINQGFTDPDGQTWDGPTITHVAAVGNPVQFRQKPFQLSQDRQPRPEVVQLSLSGYEGETMAGKKDDETTGGADLSAVIKALRETGMAIPEEVKDADGLVIAIKASQPAAPETATGTEAPPPAPVTMSMEQENQALKAALLKGHKAALPARINALKDAGRVGVDLHGKLMREAGTVQLSLDAAGELAPDKLLARIEAYEQLPAQTFLTAGRKPATQLSQEREADPPDGDDDDEKRAETDADAYLERRQGKRTA